LECASRKAIDSVIGLHRGDHLFVVGPNIYIGAYSGNQIFSFSILVSMLSSLPNALYCMFANKYSSLKYIIKVLQNLSSNTTQDNILIKLTLKLEYLVNLFLKTFYLQSSEVEHIKENKKVSLIRVKLTNPLPNQTECELTKKFECLINDVIKVLREFEDLEVVAFNGLITERKIAESKRYPYLEIIEHCENRPSPSELNYIESSARRLVYNFVCFFIEESEEFLLCNAISYVLKAKKREDDGEPYITLGPKRQFEKDIFELFELDENQE